MLRETLARYFLLQSCAWWQVNMQQPGVWREYAGGSWGHPTLRPKAIQHLRQNWEAQMLQPTDKHGVLTMPNPENVTLFLAI